MMVAAASAVAVKAVVVAKFGNCSLLVDRIGRWVEEEEVVVVVVVEDEVVAVVNSAEGEKMVAMDWIVDLGFCLTCLWVCLFVTWCDKSDRYFLIHKLCL